MNRRRELSAIERAELLERTTVSVPDAAALIGVGATALRDAMRRGELELQVIQIGSRRLVPVAALRRLLAMEVPEPAEAPLLIGGRS